MKQKFEGCHDFHSKHFPLHVMIKGEETSLSKLKVSSEARQAEATRNEARKKSLLVLILSHLQDHGYDTTKKLKLTRVPGTCRR